MPPELMLFPLVLSGLVLGLVSRLARLVERSCGDWTCPAGLSSSVWGGALALLTAAGLFLLTPRLSAPYAARPLLLAAVVLAALPALWFSLRTTHPDVTALWRAFAVGLLLLSCLLGALLDLSSL